MANGIVDAFVPPPALVEAILNGRCIAFVGAGFSAMVMPTWAELLQTLATRLGVDFDVPPNGNALHFEALGTAAA